MRNMKKWLASIAGFVAVAGVGSIAVVHNGNLAVADPVLRAAAQSQVNVDSSLGETFTPESVSDGLTKLSASSLTTGNAYEKAFDSDSIPSDATVQSGYLTMPVGAGAPGEYVADHELVYAYNWHACPPAIGPAPGPGPTDPASPSDSVTSTASPDPQNSTTNCTAWAFVNPTTGSLIDLTWTTN